jgi:Fe-S cluster assembly iron-binding protein IscA
VTLGPGTSQAILSFISDKGLHKSIRIDLNFSGCCDASLTMIADSVREGDLVLKTDGLDFFISLETYEISGDINIAYIDEPGRKGFSVTSSKPISEWDGFGICTIKT